MEDWVALYKFGRLALLAFALSGIGLWLYLARGDDFEAPARRMLDDDDLEAGELR